MNDRQSNLRRSAAEAFEESLEQLQHLLASQEAARKQASLEAEDDRNSHRSPDPPPAVPPEPEEALWEDAAADIEQYFQQQDEGIDEGE